MLRSRVNQIIQTLALTLSGIALWSGAFVGRYLTKRRLRAGELRTLWGCTPILTLPLLTRCDRMLGFKSDSLVFVTYIVTQEFDINLSRVQSAILNKAPVLYVSFLQFVLAWALIRYDVFHYYYDRGILAPSGRMGINPQELELLNRAGKVLFTYAYGADVRTRNATLALGRYNLCAECPEPGVSCICDDRAGEENIARIGEHATTMFSMGDMLSYVPKAENMHYWPIDTDKLRYVGVRDGWGEPLRIAHAPNHAHFKGTRYLLEAVERLKKEGFDIELLFIQGVSNQQVLDLYAQADVVADQFIAGFHGYAALEAMAVGKPVLCYLRGPEMMIDSETCPIINVNPDNLYATLMNLMERKIDLQKIGEDGRRYIEKYYSLPAVSARLADIYLEKVELSSAIRQQLEGFQDQVTSVSKVKVL